MTFWENKLIIPWDKYLQHICLYMIIVLVDHINTQNVVQYCIIILCKCMYYYKKRTTKHLKISNHVQYCLLINNFCVSSFFINLSLPVKLLWKPTSSFLIFSSMLFIIYLFLMDVKNNLLNKNFISTIANMKRAPPDVSILQSLI